MKIIIIGMGSIGRTVLKTLAAEDHVITIIDDDKDKVERLIEKYDVFGVVGNGASADILREAKVKDADLVIALTKSDELNILACFVAKRIGAEYTVARVRNPDYEKQIEDMHEELGVSMVVNPEKETATEIFNLINLAAAKEVEHFAGGRVLLVEILLERSCALVGETLISMNRRFNTRVLVCAVQRGDEVIIPTGNFIFHEGDHVHFTADAEALGAFLAEINMATAPLKRIMIVGGDKTAFYLASELSKKRYKVKLIENDRANAEHLAEILPKVTVVHGNGTRHDILTEEGIEATDGFVALTDIDEENMVVSMFANKMNVKRTITQIKSEELFGSICLCSICPTNNSFA